MSKILTKVSNSKNAEIKPGDVVVVVISVWREDESPTLANYYEGAVEKIVERTKDCFYVKLENLDRLIPIDRVSAM